MFKEIADKIYAQDLDLHKEFPLLAEESTGIFPVIRSGLSKELQMICDELGVSHQPSSESNWVKTRLRENVLSWRENDVHQNTVPDVMGMTPRDALYILENKGLKVRMEGTGRVKKQSIWPGSRLVEGAEILIELS